MATFAIASAQTRTVTGTVISADDNEPLAGASILPIGGGMGTSTDVDGKFTLKVNSNVHKIRVTFVGMHTLEVDITNEPMLIKMVSSDSSLDEVMVVAYGTAKKSAFTGSATVINAE
ncbi:MAG: carboxypeptidase-like regulatory domain-containing protein, partial [Paramuribaculum sp.]|nr:carboxypeptidase-like regulatory domain-containing protein [Paramuribaculum sp.]